MKIIFLDIDGVMNHHGSFRYWNEQFRDKKIYPREEGHYHSDDWCPVGRAILRYLMDRVPDANIVLSSMWRLGLDTNGVKDLFRRFGFNEEFVARVIGRTPDATHPSHHRGYEIQTWLDEHPGIESFVIIDDDSDMVHLMHRLVKTSFDSGLTMVEAKKAAAMLTGVEGD